MAQKRMYGWKPPLPQPKKQMDLETRNVLDAIELPSFVDLSGSCPSVYDQGQLGSCTANALAALYQTIQDINRPTASFTPSRLFIYYNERALEGTINQDSGASLTDGIRVVTTQGCPPEPLFPYQIGLYQMKPPPIAYQTGLEHLVLNHFSLDNTNPQEIKKALAGGYPVVCGFTVYESFETEAVAASGMMPMPEPREQIVGGHAVLIVGYNDETEMFLIRNSWGSQWGVLGYFYGPYAFFTNPDYASDFWTATKAE
jgi:C1A family cysteine protease